jgi:hypothetical protein
VASYYGDYSIEYLVKHSDVFSAALLLDPVFYFLLSFPLCQGQGIVLSTFSNVPSLPWMQLIQTAATATIGNKRQKKQKRKSTHRKAKERIVIQKGFRGHTPSHHSINAAAQVL